MTPLKIAIATILFNMNPRLQCRLKMWCHSVSRINREVFDGNATIVFLSQTAQRCADLDTVTVRYDEALLHASAQFSKTHRTNARMSGRAYLQTNFLMKWQIFRLTEYDRVLMWDTDVDPYFNGRSVPSLSSVVALKARYHIVRMPPGVMYAHHDHESPMNGGLFIVSPNLTLYDEGLAVIKRNAFNVTHGWDLAGPPDETMRKSMTKLHGTRCLRSNTWEFVCGDSDQGFFSHMMYVRRALKVRSPSFVYGSHFWGWLKPFSAPACPSYKKYALNVLGTNDSCTKLLSASSKSKRCFMMTTTSLLR